MKTFADYVYIFNIFLDYISKSRIWVQSKYVSKSPYYIVLYCLWEKLQIIYMRDLLPNTFVNDVFYLFYALSTI